MSSLQRVYVAQEDVVLFQKDHPEVSAEDAARELAMRAGLENPGEPYYLIGAPVWCVGRA